MNLYPHRITSDGPLPPCDDCGMTFLGAPSGECSVRLRAALDFAEIDAARVKFDIPPSFMITSELQDRLSEAKAEIANERKRIASIIRRVDFGSHEWAQCAEWLADRIEHNSFEEKP